MYRVLLIINLIFSLGLAASPIGKAFEALKIYDYFKAKKCFYKALKKQKPAASYGLSVIYYRTDNPFHQCDSAYKYIMQARFAFSALKASEQKELRKFGITDSSLQAFADSVFDRGYNQVKRKAEQNPEKADSIYAQFADFHFFSIYRDDALRARDLCVFSAVKKKYNSAAFHLYTLNYPESDFLYDAFYLFDKSLYEEQTTSKTVKEYAEFIKKFPANRFCRAAQNEIFFIHRKNRDKNGLYGFIKGFPDNEHVLEAWKLFFTLSVDKYTSENLADFALDYPDFPLKKTIIEEITLLGKQLLLVKSKDKYGFIDTAGTLVIDPVFEEAENFSEGLAIAGAEDKYGYIDKNGKWAVPALYDEAEPFYDGVAIVKLNKKSLLIDRTGTVISDEFDEINGFNGGMAVFRKSSKYGAINRLGNVLIPADYDKLGDFNNGHAWFEKDGKYGILDQQNFVNIFNEYDWVDNYDTVIRAKKNGLYGVIGMNGEVLIPFEFERIETCNKNTFVVVKSGKYGIMDRSGCYYVNPEYDFDAKWKAGDILNGQIVKLHKDESEALIQLNGKKLADFDEYEEINLPSEGLIRLLNRDKYSYADLKMHPAFKGSFDEAEDFRNGFAIVAKKDKFMIIDKAGNTVFNEACEEIEYFDNNCFLVTKGGLKGLLNEQLKWIILPDFNEIENITERYYELKKEGKKMLFDVLQNKIIWTEQ